MNIKNLLPVKSLCLDFPLRENYLAQIVVPADITALEAVRLTDFIKTLPQPSTAIKEV
jgi:hypothetical protein